MSTRTPPHNGRIRRPAAAVLLTAIIPAMAAGSARAGDIPAGFAYLRDVDPTIVQEMRYYGKHNFTGRRVPGYEAPECILTRKAAGALKSVQARLRNRGLSLKVYDCYRPQRAVQAFVDWARRPDDTLTKQEFYSTVKKGDLFALKYIARRSAHSRGSTVDLTIVPAKARPRQPAYRPGDPQKPCHLPYAERFPDNSLDFGTGYDCFHTLSHTANPKVSQEAKTNRALLVAEMARAGFTNYRREWWHFELRDEPYKKDFFDFPIQSAHLDVVCAGGAGVQVRDAPSSGAAIVAEVPANTKSLRYFGCEGQYDLARWHAFDAISKKVFEVQMPWCRIELQAPGGGKPVAGWVRGRYVAAPGQKVSCD